MSKPASIRRPNAVRRAGRYAMVAGSPEKPVMAGSADVPQVVKTEIVYCASTRPRGYVDRDYGGRRVFMHFCTSIASR